MRRMILQGTPRLASLALAVAAVSGCTTEPGSLVIPFSIGASSVTCENVGVDMVKMHLTEITEEGSGEPVTYEGEAPCADGEVEFTGIAVGNYEPLWTFAKAALIEEHFPLALTVGPYGEICAGGIGDGFYPGLACVGS